MQDSRLPKLAYMCTQQAHTHMHRGVRERYYNNLYMEKVYYAEEVIPQFSSTKLNFILSPSTFQCEHHWLPDAQ
jgi:hypothetical protein